MAREQFTDPICREITLADGTTKVLQPLSNVLVSVYKVNEDGTRGALATLYASRGPADATPFAGGNPFVTPAGGKTSFWADNGDYDIVLHDQDAIARIGDQSLGWEANAGADQGIKRTQLPEYGRALAPTGAVMAYAGSGDPAGWLLCDGRVLPQAGTYATLYAAIGGMYGLGNEGGGNFRLPDLRGRSILGPDDMGTGTGAAARLPSLALANRARGKSGGSDTVTLDPSQLPVHAHAGSASAAGTGISINGVGDHSHTSLSGQPFLVDSGAVTGFLLPNGDVGREIGQSNTTSNAGAHSHAITDPQHTHTITVNDSGQTRGNPVSNLHPYQILNFIIKI